MAKGKKSDKKGKKGKKSKGKSSNIDSDNNEPDPNVICGTGEFTLPNSDVYIGEYCAHRQGVIWREGRGIYKTKDGQEYEGNWHNDKLLDGSPVEIYFSEGHKYVGLLSKDKYNGPGTYYCSDVTISCNFENNKPRGQIALIDPLGEVYIGFSRENNATLLPPNVLFDNINPARGILYDPKSNIATDFGETESRITCVTSESVCKEDDSPDKYVGQTWNDIIFSKSKKTDTRMYFDESDWYKDWVRFKQTKDRIISGVPSNQEQSDVSTVDDEQWLREYEAYKQVRKLHKTDSVKVNEGDLYFAFKSAAYADKCPAVRVVYPSSNWDTFNSAKDYGEFVEDTNTDLSNATKEKRRYILKTSVSCEKVYSKPIEETASGKIKVKSFSDPKVTSKGKCLNKKNFSGSTNSLFHLVNKFLDNLPISKINT